MTLSSWNENLDRGGQTNLPLILTLHARQRMCRFSSNSKRTGHTCVDKVLPTVPSGKKLVLKACTSSAGNLQGKRTWRMCSICREVRVYGSPSCICIATLAGGTKLLLVARFKPSPSRSCQPRKAQGWLDTRIDPCAGLCKEPCLLLLLLFVMLGALLWSRSLSLLMCRCCCCFSVFWCPCGGGRDVDSNGNEFWSARDVAFRTTASCSSCGFSHPQRGGKGWW